MTRLLGALILLLLPVLAAAQETALPDPWAQYPRREAERPILPASNGYLMTAAIRSSSAIDRFNDEGRKERMVDSLQTFSMILNIEYGVNDKFELYGGLPYLTARSAEYTSGSIGSLYGGARVLVLADDRLELALGLEVAGPTGEVEFHYELEDGKIALVNFRTGNPGIDYSPTLDLRWNTGKNSLRAHLEGIFTGTGRTVLNEIGGEAETRKVNPGDGLGFSLGWVHQLDDRFALPMVFIDYYAVSQTVAEEIKFDDEQNLLQVSVGGLIHFSQDFELGAGSSLPLFGRNVPFTTPLWLELRTRF